MVKSIIRSQENETMSSSVARSTSIVILVLAMIAAAKAQEFHPKEVGEAFIQKKSAHSLVDSKSLKFKVDTAKLTVFVHALTDDNKNNLSYPVQIYFLSDYCHNCSYYYVTNITGIHKHYTTTFLVDSKWNSNVMFMSNLSKSNISCSENVSYHFGERGEYTWQIEIRDTTTNASCSSNGITVVTKPWNSYLPILVAFCILLGLAIVYSIVDTFYSRRLLNRSESVDRFINSDLGSTTTMDETMVPEPRPARERMKSVDSFRGMCIVIMIFVNYGGGSYWFFAHVAWNGLTVADLVFPWFMFIMGINIVLSIDSLERKATPKWEIAYKILRRTAILFFLGLCIINHNTDFVNMRIPGVLQRFAVAYCIVTLLHWGFHKSVSDISTMVVNATSEDGSNPWWYLIRDIKVYWLQWIIIACFEVLWHCLTFLLPLDNGCPTGYIGPGGLADHGKNFNCTGGAAAYIDRKVFGVKHLYGSTTAKKVYFPPDFDETIPFDPEGLLGSIHSILIVFLGLQAGKIYLYYKEPKQRIIRWYCWSLLLGVISAVLTKFSQYDGWIPVNKNLWSTSFVTTLSCFAFFILPTMYYIIDIKKLWTGAPFYFVGMNSIFIYVGHEVFTGYLPFSWGAGSTSTHAELLAMNMLGTTYWVIIAYYCYKIKFFVKI
uniref:heparan-alpha-glucosaminide N-acetyltransferase-like isoform X2 n=1 Tax=Styela clava TaxID=7725 RepID=UPI00193AA145|nr:heparan-alpha-glucosaminide N-acetyltransferase-like isoform X2 [Styela clava]